MAVSIHVLVGGFVRSSNPALGWVRGEGLGFTFRMSTMVLLFLIPNSLPTGVSVYLDPHGHKHQPCYDVGPGFQEEAAVGGHLGI